MSKPEKPGELRNSEIYAISLVDRAANGEKFKIFKSAKYPEPDEKGLFKILKSFFTKGAVSDRLATSENREKLYKAFEIMMSTLGLSRWENENLNPETDPAKITEAIDDFRNIALTALLGDYDDDVKEIKKVGKKISSARLSRLKDMKILIDEVLQGVHEDEAPVEEDAAEAIEKALLPLVRRIEKIENARGVSNRVIEDTHMSKSNDDFWGNIF